MTADTSQSDKLDLQTVIFKCLMDLHNTSAKIKLGQDMAFNYYAQVRNLISIIRPILDAEAVEQLNEVISSFQEKWTTRYGKKNTDGDDNDPDDEDEEGDNEKSKDPLLRSSALNDGNDHTFFCAVQLLAVAMERLNAKGIIKIQKKGSIPGKPVVNHEEKTINVTLRGMGIDTAEESIGEDDE